MIPTLFRSALAGLTVLALAGAACAAGLNADEEARAREIGKSLRCVVCQNQAIEDSNAPLAADMRQLVRERIEAGDSDQEIVDHLVDRYGTFVLMKPPMRADTWLLWFGPLLFVLAGGAACLVYLQGRPRTQQPPPSLDPGETEALRRRLQVEQER